MNLLANLTHKSALTIALFAGLAFTASAASACDYYYRDVTTYVTVQQPVAYYATRYDDCGDAYQVRLVSYRTVRVPVTQRLRFYY